MFDLPTKTNDDLRAYRKFRKALITNGFIMMQESIYVKLAINSASAEAIINRVELFKPYQGVVQVLIVTEKQFERMRYMVGENMSNIINNDERLLFL